MDGKAWMSLVQETMQAFGPHYREDMQQAIQETGVPDNWFGLSLVRGVEPVPFTLDLYQKMAPYATRERLAEFLEVLVSHELLERVGEDAYRLTGPGRSAVEGTYKTVQRSIGRLEPLPTAEMDRLNGLLFRLVEAGLTATEPQEKLALAYSRWTDPGEGAPAPCRTDQYLTDLYWFRDDAHTAAWKPLGVSGQAWEALTLVWRDEARTPEELVEALPYRSIEAEGYEATLQALEASGWVTKGEGGYNVTPEGKRIRDDAEAATDRIYLGPWSCLEEAEQNELEDLLTRLRDRLGEMAPDE